MLPWLTDKIAFPPVEAALSEPPGLLAVGGDLCAARLLAAYRRGIFPWFAPGDPILWWSPDPRMVLRPGELKISRSLARTLRNADYEVRLDYAFADVVAACANAPRDGQHGTWITPEMQLAYRQLHALGHAHSVETWIDGRLAGGLYGIALGRAFFGESMFSGARDASKIALAHLCAYLQAREFGIIDCQMETAHLASLGARPISRRDFIAALDQLADVGDAPGLWREYEIRDYFRQRGAAAGPSQGGAAKNMERSEPASPLSSGVESGFRKASLCADETDEPCSASPRTGRGDRQP